jgi:hypothetical protein
VEIERIALGLGYKINKVIIGLYWPNKDGANNIS